MKWKYMRAKYNNDVENVIYITEVYFKNNDEIIGWVDPIDLFSKGLYGVDNEDLQHLVSTMSKCLNETSSVFIIDKENESCWIENPN